MINAEDGWIASRFARLSTGLKMLLILSLGLLPLGLIAVLASVQTTQQSRRDRSEEIQAEVELTRQRLDVAIYRSAHALRAGGAAVTAAGGDLALCHSTLTRLASTRAAPTRMALYDDGGRILCGTTGYAPPTELPPAEPSGTSVIITPDDEALRLLIHGPQGAIEGVGEFSRADLARLAVIGSDDADFDLELSQGERRIVLRSDRNAEAQSRGRVHVSPIAEGQVQLRETVGPQRLSATEILLFLLPLAMWLSAAVIGWLIVDRLLLRPLLRMQKVVSAYRPGDRHLDIPSLRSPALEIGTLGQAFDQVTRTVARHEAELEAAVDRQTKLVREVHHRVKNNLQVIASLLNLHSRGSTNEQVAAAYASIQRRVDALAVVHRNHYAELEENRGVALKSLISELAANLRSTAPASAAQMAISLDIEPYYVTQDVAVSVAFLITEIIELAMFCGARLVRISLRGDVPNSALISFESASLRADTDCDAALFERFDRIITGLSRQLRSTLERDLEAGVYSVSISAIDRAGI